MINLETINDLTIVPADQIIVADGVRKVGTSAMWAAIPSTVHAIQFHNGTVDVEIDDADGNTVQNNILDSLSELTYSGDFDWTDYDDPSVEPPNPEPTFADRWRSIVMGVRELIQMASVHNITNKATYTTNLIAILDDLGSEDETTTASGEASLETIRVQIVTEINSEVLGITYTY